MKKQVLIVMIMMIMAASFYNIIASNTVKADETGTNTGTVTAVPSSINIVQYPAKTVYSKGESLDLSDMILQAYYLDGTSQTITDYTVSGYDSNLIGTQTVSISYQGYTVTINVMVFPAKITNISVSGYTNSSVTFTWDAVPEALRYEIYTFDSASGTYVFNTTAYTNSVTMYYPAATTFGIEVCAVVNAGGLDYRGTLSDIYVAATAPDAASGLAVTSITASSVALSWNSVPGASGYIVYRSKNAGKDYTICKVTNTTVYADEKLSSGTAYQYKVCAYAYNEKFSGQVSNIIDTSTNPAKMTIKYKAGEQKVRITWSAVTGASYYDIYLGDAVNGYLLATTVKASSNCAYVLEGLTTDQTYGIYAVARRVYNGSEYKSENSNLSSVLITEVAPTSTEAKVFPTEQDFLKSSAYTGIAFFKKYVSYTKSFVMPGLISTNVGGFASTAMCPQGITFAGKYLLLTAYDMKAEENSVIYVMDKSTKELLTTLILPSKTHAGGIAYDGTNVWVPYGKKISSIPFKQIKEAVAAGTPYSYVTYNTNCTLSISVSYMTWYNDKLWIGTYNELETTKMYSYTIENKDTAPTVKQTDTIVMPTRVQGMAFTDEGVLILSRSCQLYKGLRGYMRQLDLYQPDFANAKNGVISLGKVINTVEMPSMNEDITINGSYLYVCFESAAFQDASYKMDRICAFKLTSLTKKVS